MASQALLTHRCHVIELETTVPNMDHHAFANVLEDLGDLSECKKSQNIEF